jgi:hypothetical protein
VAWGGDRDDRIRIGGENSPRFVVEGYDADVVAVLHDVDEGGRINLRDAELVTDIHASGRIDGDHDAAILIH